MAHASQPAYTFRFHWGLSTLGVVERICDAIDEGRPHHFRYRLNDLPLTRCAGRPMPALVADLLDVSAAAYIADRLALRELKNDPRPASDRWHRRLHVVIAVRHPGLWRQPDVVACLEKLLAFQTDDIWSFEFVARTSHPRPSEAQMLFVQPPDRNVAVALHSGGLDSLFGLISLAKHGAAAPMIPVTVTTNARVQHMAAAVIGELRRWLPVAGQQIRTTALRVGICGAGRLRDDREPSQRVRGLLFPAAGLATAALVGTDQLQVCENGVGAIGLAMTADHWGARATRSMHPKTLALLGRLFSLVLDRTMSVHNSGLFATKGELARRLNGPVFVAAARHTTSCDRATYSRIGENCGRCTSCILRRVALSAAGLERVVDGSSARYRTDLLDPRTMWTGKTSVHLMAMRHQVELLRRVTEGTGGFAALDAAFPDLFEVVDLAPSFGLAADEVERRLFHLYLKYVGEFDAFVAKIDRPGWGRRATITQLSPNPEAAAVG